MPQQRDDGPGRLPNSPSLPSLPIGATVRTDGSCGFRVWAPLASAPLAVHLLGPEERIVPMKRAEHGYQVASVPHVAPGTRYRLLFPDGRELPDPASRSQPEGVHGPSAVVAPYAAWGDAGWAGVPLADYVLYELHIGTFTPEGTFDAVIPHLDELVDLGITVVEIMPIGQFPGDRNWGYDGTYPFAPQQSYGGPAGFARLVDACHSRGLAVVLDVVYNHLGPEGNYTSAFGPYFTTTYQTPWGAAINFDDAGSDEVRAFFTHNALMWVRDYHVDALRLDAVHAIRDFSAQPFLAELAEAVHAFGTEQNRKVYLIAESDLNDPRLVEGAESGGMGLDAQWSDDFHHAVHALLTGERDGYYQDYGSIEHVARALRETFVYAGTYSPFRQRRQGRSARHIPPDRFIFSIQNHDQVGNRMRGERLSQLVTHDQSGESEPSRAGLAALKLTASVLLLAPALPLLFMGEEYGETNPFQFFISHGDRDLIAAVRAGRSAEFAAFAWQGDVPDPQDAATFMRSKLDRGRAQEGWHATLRAYYRELLRLRREVAPLRHPCRETTEVTSLPESQIILLRRWHEDEQVLALFHFGSRPQRARVPFPPGEWRLLFESPALAWSAPDQAICSLAPYACAVFILERNG